jgi:hypothetical protein
MAGANFLPRSLREGGPLLWHPAAVHDLIVQRAIDDQKACQAPLRSRQSVIDQHETASSFDLEIGYNGPSRRH